MKQHIFVIAFFCVLIFAGCERERNEKIEYERTIWVNPDVECCGVKDPLNNLEWISQTPHFGDYKTASYSYSNHILLFNNDTTQENFIVFSIKENRSHLMFYVIIYDCNGNVLDGGTYKYQNENSENIFSENMNLSPAEPCFICDEFFKTHTLMDTIAYFIVEPKI